MHVYECRYCGADITKLDGTGWVDIVSGDDGGTYDFCNGHPSEDFDDKLHQPTGKPKDHCDYCRKPMHQDANGYWVGADESSDCPDNPRGHEVDGAVR